MDRVPDSSHFVSVGDFAEILGVSCWTVYEMIKRDELPGARHFGRVIRIHVPTAMAWITGQRSTPSEKREPQL